MEKEDAAKFAEQLRRKISKLVNIPNCLFDICFVFIWLL